MNKPFFSIVTVCYNSEKTISNTLDSVLAQNFIDYEYIIVDGGSTDKTLDIIKSYELKFGGRMKWKSEPDKGIYDAFNKGCKIANGLYIWIVNSDDYIETNVLATINNIVSRYKTQDYPIISGALNFRGYDGKILRISKSSAEKAKIAYDKGWMGIVHPATLVPKSVYEIVGYYDDSFKISGDTDWFHRAYSMNMKFLFIDDIITNMNDGGISNQIRYKILEADYSRFAKKKYPNVFVRALKYMIWNKRLVINILKKGRPY